MEGFSKQDLDPLKMSSSLESELCELVTYTTAIDDDDDNDWDYDFGNDTGESAMILLADGTPVLADDQVVDHQPIPMSDSSQLSIVPLSNLLSPSLNPSNEQQHPELHVGSSSVQWKKPAADDCVGALSCNQCSYTCDDQTSLRQHTAQHSSSATLHCVYCSYTTISDTNFARHITDHEIEKAALERGEELGHDFVSGSVSDPLQQTSFQGEEEDDWQMGCSQIDPLAPDSRSPGGTNEGHSQDSLPSTEGQQTTSPKNGSAILKGKVSKTVAASRRASKRKIASREDASPSSRPLTDSHSSNLISSGNSHENANDPMRNTKETSGKKRAKITDYFGALSSKTRPAQPSSSKSLRKTCGKWRCPHCPYSSKRKFAVEKHFASHDLDNSSKENSFEVVPSTEALLQPKEEVDELPEHCHCDNDYDEDNISSVDSQAPTGRNTFNCNVVSESPLQTYLSKNRLDNNSGRDLLSFSNHNQENEFENVTLLDCPFCTVRSRNQIAHENHITLCHIDEKEALGNKGQDVPAAQASPSSNRVSNRPSTSRFKQQSLQVTASGEKGRNKSDFIELFDSDESDPEFTGFHDDAVQRRLTERSMRNLTTKQLAIQNSASVASARHTQSKSKVGKIVPKWKSSQQQSLKPTSQLDMSPATQRKPNWNQPSTERTRVSEPSIDCNYTCPLCSFMTIVRLQFLHHVKTDHAPGEVFVCTTCSLTSTNSWTIINHRKRGCSNAGHNVSLHLCPNCPFQSIYFKSYERHILNCSKVLCEEGYDRDGKNMCPFCHYRSFNIETYKEHLLNHIRSEALSCPRCPFKTCRKDMYRWHLKIEHAFVPGTFRCEACDFVTLNYVLYIAHMSTHFPLRRKVASAPLPKSIAVVLHQELSNHMKREFGLRDSSQSDDYRTRHQFTIPPLKYVDESPKKKSTSSSPKDKIIDTGSKKTYKYNSAVPKLANKAIPKKRGRPKKSVPSDKHVMDHSPPFVTSLDNFLHPVPAMAIAPSPKKRGRPKKQIQPSKDVPVRSPPADTGLDKFLVRTPAHDGYIATPKEEPSPSSPARTKKTKPHSPQAAAVVAVQPPAVVLPQRAAVSTKTPVCAASSFVCPFCSQVFTSNTQLVRHVAVHTDRGRMTCPVCNFSTMDFPALQSHLRSLHQELCF